MNEAERISRWFEDNAAWPFDEVKWSARGEAGADIVRDHPYVVNWRYRGLRVAREVVCSVRDPDRQRCRIVVPVQPGMRCEVNGGESFSTATFDIGGRRWVIHPNQMWTTAFDLGTVVPWRDCERVLDPFIDWASQATPTMPSPLAFTPAATNVSTSATITRIRVRR